jgi:hypothetical protein
VDTLHGVLQFAFALRVSRDAYMASLSATQFSASLVYPLHALHFFIGRVCFPGDQQGEEHASGNPDVTAGVHDVAAATFDLRVHEASNVY